MDEAIDLIKEVLAFIDDDESAIKLRKKLSQFLADSGEPN